MQPVPGEPSRLALISFDQTLKVYAKIVAIPQKGEDKGCSVEATLLTPGAELVVIEATGFPANADIVMDSDSEAIVTKPKARQTRTDATSVHSCPSKKA